jgi:hypothetical protein
MVDESGAIAEIRDELGRLIDRLDDLVYDAMRRQLHGEDALATEKRLSRARNALRRAHGLLATSSDGEPDWP